MRGKQKTEKKIGTCRRITPAHAGKTDEQIKAIREGTDHPRTCGENALFRVKKCPFCGSPPHMRGKHGAPLSQGAEVRITPAHAGKTGKERSIHRNETDHPRTCGENKGMSLSAYIIDGSPPHMRGKRSIWLNYANAMRITPAHAGKTPTILPIVPKAPDHPRTCGENFSNSDMFLSDIGSPPHMRGKQMMLGEEAYNSRITPAHAGKTITPTDPM